jgi:hypothetical protein
VLKEYEDREEFVVHPNSGGVQYGTWWSVGNCRRPSRNYFEVNLRKLYEGAPANVIHHFNRFAVTREIAEDDRETICRAAAGSLLLAAASARVSTKIRCGTARSFLLLTAPRKRKPANQQASSYGTRLAGGSIAAEGGGDVLAQGDGLLLGIRAATTGEGAHRL